MKFKIILLFIITSFSADAQLKLAQLFSDHMVLQRQKPIQIWGWSAPNDIVKVELANQSKSIQADLNGKWILTMKELEAGGPHKMNVSTKKEKIEINDILIGEVWLLSGQSNMEWSVKDADNFKVEKQNADYNQIRHFFVEHSVEMTPQKDLKLGNWKISSSETVGDFSAIGFFFARELNQKLKIPIGLVHSSWGGSQIEGWISKEAMMTDNDLKNYANNLPNDWSGADLFHDKNVRKKIFGSDINPTLEDEKKYTQPNAGLSKWVNANDPFGQWDWKGIWSFRGKGFMAKSIDIPESMIDSETVLGLGIQDNFNEIYINGKLVFAGVLKGKRKIIIPPNSWKSTDNQLVIKFENMLEKPWFGLGIEGSQDDIFISNHSININIAKDWKLMPAFAEKHNYVHSSNNIGTSIYNGMIAPLVPFGIKGALWYQGETNAGRAEQYQKSFPLMINDWRNKWKDEFPFYFVQLSSYGSLQNSNEGSNWAELREAQTMTLNLPKTGMAVTTDVGNPNDIHPRNKQTVAQRLAAIALKNDYGQSLVASGPMFSSFVVEENKAILTFHNMGKGLMIKDKFGYLKGFEVAGDDKVFYYAKAEIVGEKVVVVHPKNQKIVAVRYAWADAPEDANLFNLEGFPANSFRTDNWKMKTAGNKFE